MARGRSLSLCIDDLKAELLQASAVNVGITARDALKRRLQTAQNFLFLDKVWPHKRLWQDKTISAGSRWVDIPSRIKIENIRTVHVYFNGKWSDPLPRGIGVEHYNAYNSDNDARADPVQRWDIRDNSGTAQIEVHPLPATTVTDGLKFVGVADLAAFVDDADTCDLDSECIVLTAAADMLERSNPQQAAMLRKRAVALVNRHVGGAGKSKNRYSFADGCNDGQAQRSELNVVYAR